MMKITYTLIIAFLFVQVLTAQDVKEDILVKIDENTFDSDTEIVIKNINGSVHVSGYNEKDIVIEGTKELWKRRGAVSKNEAYEYAVKKTMYEGKLYIYVEGPESNIEFKNGRMNYSWNSDHGNDIKSNFELEIKIPKNQTLDVSTVNGDVVYVENMENGVMANNVNGSVFVKDVKGHASANTVNGNIEVWYLESPSESIDYKTVNGNIEIYSPNDLSAIVTFESLHGELYTDFEQVKHLPNRLNKEKAGGGFRYLLNKTSPIQIGSGEVEIGFKMVNGDAYIRTRKS